VKEKKMFELKPLPQTAVQAALEKADRYRLLNEAVEAESICLDIIGVEPDNQEALIMLFLAQTDQFKNELSPKFPEARETLKRIKGDYSRTYYKGILCERRAKVHLYRDIPGSGQVAYDWFRQAMNAYAKAMEIRPPGNDASILRWNTCARIIMRNPGVAPAAVDAGEQMLE
jgi:hypothetical protein